MYYEGKIVTSTVCFSAEPQRCLPLQLYIIEPVCAKKLSGMMAAKLDVPV